MRLAERRSNTRRMGMNTKKELEEKQRKAAAEELWRAAAECGLEPAMKELEFLGEEVPD